MRRIGSRIRIETDGREANMPDAMKIGGVGGDGRMLAAARYLAEKGERYECAVWGLDALWGEKRDPASPTLVRCRDPESAVRGADAVLLPLPVSRDGVKLNAPLAGSEPELVPLLREMKPGGMLFGGRIPGLLLEAARERGIRTFDYFEDEAFQIRNAVPTAEGAVAACMEALPITVAGMRCAVLGYGRVGRTLARKLCALGAETAAVARNPRDLARAETDGCRPMLLEEFRAAPPHCAAVFNTIPARILNGEVLGRFDRETVLFDLASGGTEAPGVDAEEARRLGIRVIPLPSLPGKAAPVTAGEIIGKAVLRVLETEEREGGAL
jgi:dipicolinate synthase subunit A